MSDICKNDGTYFNQWGVCETCGNTREKQDAAEAAPAQKFCMKCGAPLNGAKFCAACGTAAGKKGTPAKPKIDVKAVIKDAFEHIRAFFTANPFSAVRNAALSVNPIWMAMGVIVCLLATLGFFSGCNYTVYAAGEERINLIYMISVLVLGISEISGMMNIESMMSMNGLGGEEMVDRIEKMGKTVGNPVALVFILLLLMIVVFFAGAVLVKLFFMITRKKVTWTKSFNVYSVSLLPFALACAAAFIAGFMSPAIAIALLLLGGLFHFIYLYFGIQKAAPYEKSPFWLYSLLVTAQCIVTYLVVLLFFAVFC